MALTGHLGVAHFFAAETITVGYSTPASNGPPSPPFHPTDPPHPSREATCSSSKKERKKKNSGNRFLHSTLYTWLYCHSCAGNLGVSASPRCHSHLSDRPNCAEPSCLQVHLPPMRLIGEAQSKEVLSRVEPPCADADKNPSLTEEKAL